MGLVQKKAESEICESIHDLGYQKQRSDNCRAQTDNIRAVERDVHAQNNIDCGSNTAGRPDCTIPERHPLSGTGLIWAVDYEKDPGRTLHEYQRAKRMERAMDALRAGDEPVQSICHRLGFGSHSYFTKQFRKHTGMTPNDYRRHNGQN